MGRAHPEQEWELGSSRAWMFLVCKLAVGVLCLWGLLSWVESEWLARQSGYASGLRFDPQIEARRANRLMGKALVGFTLLMGAWMAYGAGRALRVIRNQRYPAPGERVLVRTRVRRGAAARRVGYIQLVTSVLVGVGLVFAAWQGSHILSHELLVAGSRQQKLHRKAPEFRPIDELRQHGERRADPVEQEPRY